MKNGIVIGAGIGGLTTAIALAQKGIKVKIYEQTLEIEEVGAGIWVAPNGLKIYRELGISKDIIDSGKILDNISVVDLNYNPISVINGERILARHGFKTVAIHRAVLHKILLSNIPAENIILNKKFKSYQQTGKSIIAEFDDGTKTEADFLIVADGINSTGRSQIHPGVQLRYSGQTCWRFVAAFELPKESEGNMFEIWGNTKGLRIGYSKINEKEVYVFITNFQKPGGKDTPGTIKEDLLKLCVGFPYMVKSMIVSVKSNDIIRTDLFDFKPISNWVDKRAVLLGDAAHATTPNLGQGACQAIEDAFVLAKQLSMHDDVESSLQHFQLKRIRKARFITNTSWLFGQMTNTSGITKSIIKTILRRAPKYMNEKQLDKIYAVDY